MNHHYIPTAIRIEKNLGTNVALETFKVDTTEQELHYVFHNNDGQKELRRALNAKHHLTTPSFATTTFFTLNKKFDQTGRTPVILVSSPNDWEFTGDLQERVVYGEFRNRDSSVFKINNKELEAYHLCLFESSAGGSDEDIVDIYISKYHGLPYELVHGEKKIVAKMLKKNY